MGVVRPKSARQLHRHYFNEIEITIIDCLAENSQAHKSLFVGHFGSDYLNGGLARRTFCFPVVTATPAALGSHVGQVFSLCAQTQVRVLPAQWVITAVQNNLVVRDRTMPLNPRCAVHLHDLFTDPDLAVSVSSRWAKPDQAVAFLT